ncbi:MAG TPA: hypothetical protein VJ789_13280 [Burkholderiales bacterium]|nr:hypothetical protein [Burkholderiales bacterium]
MSQPLKPVLALTLAVGVALSGCATSPPPTPSGADVRGQVPAEGLPHVSRVVANELPISLVGFWNDPKEREEFEKRRAAIIAERVEANRASGADMAAGIAVGSLRACLLLGPFCVLALPAIPVAAAVAGTADYSRARIVAGRGVEYIPITESNSQRLSALYSGTLTGVALGERTLRLARSGPAPVDAAADYPRVVVTMKSATVRMDAHEELRVKVVAEAQAQPSPGVTWAPTEHVIDMELWQRYDYTVAVQKILDVLAQSIVATYLPQHPHSVEKRHWDDVRTKDAAQVQTYLERYPNGTFAELARQQLGELSAQEAAAREAVTDAWAAKSLFRRSARVRPELEGRWTGSAPVPFCGRTSYAILIKDGYVEGTVEWQLSALFRIEVAGYVKEDGSVTVVPISSGRVDRSQSLDLVPRSGRLTGPSAIACVPASRHLVTLGRD